MRRNITSSAETMAESEQVADQEPIHQAKSIVCHQLQLWLFAFSNIFFAGGTRLPSG